MYFMAENLFHAVLAAGITIETTSFGEFAVDGVHGRIINLDAISINDLNEDLAQRVALTMSVRGGCRFDRRPAESFPGLEIITLVPERESRARENRASENNAEPARQKRAARMEEAASVSSRREPRASFTDISNLRFEESYVIPSLRRLCTARRPPNSSIEFIGQTGRAKGLPEAPSKDDVLQIAINVFPKGSVAGEKKISVFNVFTGGDDTIRFFGIPEIPGMKSVRMHDAIVAHYDSKRLFIHVTRPDVWLFLIAAWLEMLAPEGGAEVSDGEIDAMAQGIALSLKDVIDRDEINHQALQREIISFEDRLSVIEVEMRNMEASRSTLQSQNTTYSPGELIALIETIEEEGFWRFSINAPSEDILFRPASREIIDPRGGRRVIPNEIVLSLRNALCLGQPFVFRRGQEGGHPRLFGGTFLSDEVSSAFQAMLRGKELHAALGLARDVLTNFSLSDEDLCGIDNWELVENDMPLATAA